LVNDPPISYLLRPLSLRTTVPAKPAIAAIPLT
jgi:hypothetical protein